MKGKPKHLNSREDYLYIKDNYEAEYWKPIWKNMLNQRYHWVPTDIFTKEEKCVTDSLHRYEKIDAGENPKFQQYELMEDPSCDMIQFGFSEAEIRAALVE